MSSNLWWTFFRIEELSESLDEREKIKQVVKEKEEKIETLNKSFDEKDKLLQELESRFVENQWSTYEIS